MYKKKVKGVKQYMQQSHTNNIKFVFQGDEGSGLICDGKLSGIVNVIFPDSAADSINYINVYHYLNWIESVGQSVPKPTGVPPPDDTRRRPYARGTFSIQFFILLGVLGTCFWGLIGWSSIKACKRRCKKRSKEVSPPNSEEAKTTE